MSRIEIPTEPSDMSHEREAKAYAEAANAPCLSWGDTCDLCKEAHCVCDEPVDSDRATVRAPGGEVAA